MNHSVEIVVMETMSLRQQMQKIYCTDVLIGVHGAGLTWYVFIEHFFSLGKPVE